MGRESPNERFWANYNHSLGSRCHVLLQDIFRFSEDYIKLKRGSIRATCLIETITAAFQMDEFIYALREYSSGL